jgi:hypothetical protein
VKLDLQVCTEADMVFSMVIFSYHLFCFFLHVVFKILLWASAGSPSAIGELYRCQEVAASAHLGLDREHAPRQNAGVLPGHFPAQLASLPRSGTLNSSRSL